MQQNILIAWAAGIFEGEGSITKRKGEGNHHWQLAVSSTDEDVIIRLQSILGGKMYGPYGYVNGTSRRREHHKPYWRWSVSDKLGIEAVAEMLKPYLLSRRLAKLTECLEGVAQTPFTRKPHRYKRSEDN